MTAYYIICLFLSHTIDVFVHCLDTVSAQTTILPHKTIQCIAPFDWIDTSGSGTMAGTEHFAPDAAIFNGKDISLARNGEIVTSSGRTTGSMLS